MNLSSDELKRIMADNPDLQKANCEAPQQARKASEVIRGTSEPARSKYGNRRTELNGRVYSSGREAARAGELQLMEKAHEIFGLCYQVRFPLSGGTYVADFLYSQVVDGVLVTVVEDSKGFKTPIYRRNRRQMKEQYGVEIKES